jgi:hypothetical protein
MTPNTPAENRKRAQTPSPTPQGALGQDGKYHHFIGPTRCVCGATIPSFDDICPRGAVQVR